MTMSTTSITTGSGTPSGSIASAGLFQNADNNKQKVQIVRASFWKKENVDVFAFVAWLRTKRFKTYGPLSAMYESCVVCNGNTSDKAECRQLCLQHREHSESLDTYRSDGEQQIGWSHAQLN